MTFSKEMKTSAKFVSMSAVTLICGFFAGRFYQHSTAGYNFALKSESEHEFDLGTVSLQTVSESVGTSLLSTDTTRISFANRLLYEAKRDFQESAPIARNLEVNGNQVSWQDGDYRYDLAISTNPNTKMENKTEQATPKNPSD